MRAVRYEAVGAQPRLVDVPEPECPPDGALIAVRATGLCRSDWHAWQGHEPTPLPLIPGHELAGTVIKVGPQVRAVRVGDRVTVPFACGCGTCDVCQSGNTHICPDQEQPGFTHDGSFAEVVAIRAADTNVVRLPDEVDFISAAALGCRFATAFRAIVTRGHLEAGEWLAVHGCGGVGLSAIMIATAMGARVVALDLADEPLVRAQELGADALVRVGDDTLEQILAASNGGVDLSVDAVGDDGVFEVSFASLRPGGRHIQVGLVHGDAVSPQLELPPLIAKEISIVGSHGMPASGYKSLLGLVASGRLRPAQLVGRTIGLEDAPAALANFATKPSGGMTVIRL